jgi:tyrosinase
MATYVRKNAWNNSGDFSNPDLLWYAKGVGKMMDRPLDDQKSWWFYAAIHGEYVSPENAQPQYPGWAHITAPPSVPTSPLPAQNIRDKFWNQCQHQSWYFLPWHRGYLLALEAQLRTDIVALGGPQDWSLPYWNYLGGTNGSQYTMPPAFAQPALPDGQPNPLFVAMRYGPDGDSNIYVPTAAAEAAHPGDPNFVQGEVTDACLQNTIYTGSNAQTKPPGFGGPDTGFSHGGGTSGNLESDPHNDVHVYVGGAVGGLQAGSVGGLMTDPGLAALDPIFYLHHANIDRMWAVWNASGHHNPTLAKWLNGPTREFVMPTPGGASWVYKPAEMTDLSNQNYTYQELPTPPTAPHALLAQRLNFLGANEAAVQVQQGEAPTRPPQPPELLGASEAPLPIQGVRSETSVKLDSGVRRKAAASFAKPTAATPPDNVYLKVEDVRGTFDAAVLNVYVNLPENVRPRDGRKFLAGHVALFGLLRASLKDGQHAGSGLSFILDISPIVDELYRDHAFNVDALRVTLVPNRKLPDQAKITVGRISVFRQGS